MKNYFYFQKLSFAHQIPQQLEQHNKEGGR